MTIQYNQLHITPQTITTTNYHLTNEYLLQNDPRYKQKKIIAIINPDTLEIIWQMEYNWIYWQPFREAFETYQKQHIKFDVYTFYGEKTKFPQKDTKLFRKYQQTAKGTWVKKPYTPHL